MKMRHAVHIGLIYELGINYYPQSKKGCIRR